MEKHSHTFSQAHHGCYSNDDRAVTRFFAFIYLVAMPLTYRITGNLHSMYMSQILHDLHFVIVIFVNGWMWKQLYYEYIYMHEHMTIVTLRSFPDFGSADFWKQACTLT